MKLNLFEPQVMAIINITPDSFYEGSRTSSEAQIKERVEEAISQGASILDIGGYSSRPGADDVPLEEEWRRVKQGIKIARRVWQEVTISVDTFRSEVARRAYEEVGEIIVNDISGGDDDMYKMVGELGLPYILMHMRGTPSTMQSLTEYDNIMQEVKEYFTTRIEKLKSYGAKEIILDPGFGFAKTVEQNYTLLKELGCLAKMGYPVLSGVSRKSMIYRPLGITPEESLAGTCAINWESLRGGATILRVHDVKEARHIVELFKLYSAPQTNP